MGLDTFNSLKDHLSTTGLVPINNSVYMLGFISKDKPINLFKVSVYQVMV
jgi:hypothetical protein